MGEDPTSCASQPEGHPLQIVLCLDGTNNTLTGRQRDTNVLKLFEALTEANSPDQVRYYDPGVGSPDSLPITDFSEWISRKWERITGLATGSGIYENIIEAYLYLMKHWRPGCQVFLIGFSRGAFTARSVSGMVNLFGILKPEHDALLQTLLRVYFAKAGESSQPGLLRWRTQLASSMLGMEVQEGAERTREQVADQINKSFAQPQSLNEKIQFIGVWDSVESVGMPGFAVRITSQSTIVGKCFRHVRHALSLDEHRHSFLPRLYAHDNFGDETSPQSLKQMWFPGVHADCGGGYSPDESGLSDISYLWMTEEAHKCGLRNALHPVPRSDRMKPNAAPAARLMHDELHTVPWWAVAGVTARDTTDEGKITPVPHPSAAAGAPLASAWDRPRSKTALVLSALGCLLGMLLYGLAVTDWSSQGVAIGLRQSLFGGTELNQPGLVGFLHYQLFVFEPAIKWMLGWLAHLIGGGVSPVWEIRYSAHLGWATAAEILIMASYCFLFGRLTSWSITNLAGRRVAGQSMPRWLPLGRTLTLMVVGDIVENICTLALPDTADAMAVWRVPILVLVSVGSLTKYIGLIGVFVLLFLGVKNKGRRDKFADSSK